jgi:hypothetical protein
MFLSRLFRLLLFEKQVPFICDQLDGLWQVVFFYAESGLDCETRLIGSASNGGNLFVCFSNFDLPLFK